MWTIVALNGTKPLSHLSNHQHHQNGGLSGDHDHAPAHDSAVYSFKELGLAQSKCPSKSIGIPGIIQATLDMPGFIHNRDVASSSSTSERASPPISIFPPSPQSVAKRSWIITAVNKVERWGQNGHDKEERVPWSLNPWSVVGVIGFGFLLLAMGAVLVRALIGLSSSLGSQLKLKLREHRERREAQKAQKRSIPLRLAAAVSPDAGSLSPAQSMPNHDFFTVPEDMEIGFASTPGDGVVDDEALERGRPLGRCWSYASRKPRTGLASSSTADGKNKRKAARISGRDDSKEGDAGAVPE
ncbi:hypothetical protein MMC22_009359 [Lobaria immixta]|nr:hypothetical protein [Lobaria immixta]